MQSALKVKKSCNLWNSGLCFFNCESTCDLTDVPVLIYDRKMNERPFYTLRCLSLVQSRFKDRNTPIWRIGNQRVKDFKFSLNLFFRMKIIFIYKTVRQKSFLIVCLIFIALSRCQVWSSKKFFCSTKEYFFNTRVFPCLYERVFHPLFVMKNAKSLQKKAVLACGQLWALEGRRLKRLIRLEWTELFITFIHKQIMPGLRGLPMIFLNMFF